MSKYVFILLSLLCCLSCRVIRYSYSSIPSNKKRMATSNQINHRLVANIQDEPEQMLKPIAGYEKEPLLPLEEACKPLQGVLNHELKQNITIAKINSKQPEYGLTEDEAAAIHLYTMEWQEHEESLYFVLNKTLRLADRTQLRPWFRYLKLFLTGLFKLPPTEYQAIWRGISQDLSALYTTGKEFTWWALSSCTTTISVLQSPLYVGTSGPRTMFSIESNSGKSIRAMSYFQHEDEILLPPGRYLRVVDKSNPAPDLHIIHLREVEPPYPLLADPFDLTSSKPPSTTPIVESVAGSRQQEKSPVSRKVLLCKGRVCAKCGECRDWCWTKKWFWSDKNYTKRLDATCIGGRSLYLGHLGYTLHYHDYPLYTTDGYLSGRTGTTTLGILCECEDNRK